MRLADTSIPVRDLTKPEDWTHLAKMALDKQASSFAPRMVARDLELPYGRSYLDVRTSHYAIDVLAGGSSFSPGKAFFSHFFFLSNYSKNFTISIFIFVLGITTSMWYVGENGASTAMRLERGAVGASHLLRSGGANAWHIIMSPSGPAYCKAVGSLSLVANLGDNRYCSNNHIQYYDFIQQPCDLVYVSPHTTYFTVSISANICESMNIMQRLLTTVNLQPTFFGCQTKVGGIGKLEIDQPLVLVQEITHLSC